MKVVLVNHSDVKGGASVVSARLMFALAAKGIDARMLVMHKSTDSLRIDQLQTALRRRAAFLAEAGQIYLSNGFHRSDIFKVSTASFGMRLHDHPWVVDADVVVLNWVNQGMLSLAEIARIDKPIVWTMHDMWNLTGACHHSGDCRRYMDGCGLCKFFHDAKRHHDLSSSVFKRKLKLYHTKQIHFVAVSRWLADLAKESPLLRKQHIEVIPNAFPVDDFSPSPQHPREHYGLPQGRRLIAMGAARLDDPIKGLDMAIDALNMLEGEDAAAVLFGEIREPQILQRLRMPYVHLGTVTSREALSDIYAHSDVVLSSSVCETLPGTLIEGMACGCAPVAFLSGGQPDIVEHGVTGFLAPAGSVEALAEGIRAALRGEFDVKEIRASVARKFSASKIADRYIALFDTIAP